MVVMGDVTTGAVTGPNRLSYTELSKFTGAVSGSSNIGVSSPEVPQVTLSSLAEVPHTVLSISPLVPQTTLSSNLAVPHTMLSSRPSAALPHTTLGQSAPLQSVPHTMLSSVSAIVPQTMLSSR